MPGPLAYAKKPPVLFLPEQLSELGQGRLFLCPGAVITELRVKKGISYQEVAHVVGCHVGHMNEIENGKQNPTFSVLQAIADFHHMRLSRLFSMAEDKYTKRRRRRPKPSS
jgi:transcriptional regulator with XRE-family HTH domain